MDLITLQQALAALPNIPLAQQGNIPSLITQASDIAENYCNRKFPAADYDEVYDTQQDSAVILRKFPVNSIARVSACPSPVLTIQNTNATSGMPRSNAGLATTGSYDTGFTVTGVNLVTWVSGVKSTTLVPIAGNPTIGQLASAINAVGDGWQTIVNTGYQNYPTSDLMPIQGMGGTAQNEFNLMAFLSDISNFDVDPRTGELRITEYNKLGPWMGTGMWFDFPWGRSGWRVIRVQYNAGYMVIPPAVQQAVIMIVKNLYQLDTQYSIFKRERLYDYEYEVAGFKAIPDAARDILINYKEWRASGTI